MTAYKEECKKLLKSKAKVYIVDYNKDSGKYEVFERIVVGVFCSKNGRNNVWGVNFDKPIPGECYGATYNSLYFSKTEAIKKNKEFNLNVTKKRLAETESEELELLKRK